MPNRTAAIEQRLQQIRSDFDDSFAAAPPERVTRVGMLIAKTAGGRFAFRMEELSGVERLSAPVPLPRQAAPLLGIIAIRGELVAVFDLGALLGSSEPNRSRRWIALFKNGGHTVALAFEELIGLQEIRPEDISAVDESGSGGFTPQAIRDEAGSIRIINLAAVRQKQFGG